MKAISTFRSRRLPSFLAVNKKTGVPVWLSNLPTARYAEAVRNGKDPRESLRAMANRGEVVTHGQWGSPAAAVINGQAQVIFPGGDGWLYSFEPTTGKLIWKFDCNPKAAAFGPPRSTRNDLVATPAIHDNKLYIGVGQDPEHGEGVCHFWCIDLVRATRLGPGNRDWDVSPVNDNFDPQAEVNRRSALAWHYGGPGDPKKLGRRHHFGRTLSTAAVHDGLVYIAELAGYLHCLDARTGELYWRHDLDAPCWSSPYWIDGKVYLGHDKGTVLVFSHGKTKKLLAEIDVDATLRTTPVAANGVLYLTTQHGTFLYAIASK